MNYQERADLEELLFVSHKYTLLAIFIATISCFFLTLIFWGIRFYNAENSLEILNLL